MKEFLFRLLLFSFLFLTNLSIAQDVVHLNKPQPIPLIDHIAWFYDSVGNQSVSAIRQKYTQGQFHPLASSPLLIKPYQNYWLRFEAINDCPNDLTWMLLFQSQITHAWIYWNTQNDTGPPIESEHFNNNARNRVLLPAPYHQSTVYYIKIYNRLMDKIAVNHIQFVPQERGLKIATAHGFVIGIIQGVLLFMLIYSAFLFFNYRQRMYLYYFLYILSNILFSYLGTYVVDFYIYTSHPWRCYQWYPTAFFGIIFYLLFFREFTGPSNIPKHLDKWFLKPYIAFISLVNVTIITIDFISEKYFWFLLNYVFIICAFFGFVLIIYIYSKVKSKVILLILSGSAGYALFGFLSNMLDVFNLPYDNQLYNIGLLIELFIFTYAINYKQRLANEEQRLNELEFVRTKLTLESRQRELTEKTMHSTQQEQFLSNLREQLLEVKSDSPQTKSAILKILSDIESYLKFNSWEDFEMYFNEVNPGFYKKLKEDFPDLSQNELQVCALIRLNLNTKKISEITQKSAKSIEVMRTRIRAKMGLTRDDNLFDVISGYL